MNLANKITLSRIILGPLFLVSFLSHREYLSVVFLSLNLIGDLLDGYLARKQNKVTKFGEILDPAVDLLFFLFVVLSFCHRSIYEINWFLIPLAFIVLAFILVYIRKGEIMILHTKTKYVHSPFLYLMVFMIILGLDFKIVLLVTLIFLSLSSFELLLRSVKYFFN